MSGLSAVMTSTASGSMSAAGSVVMFSLSSSSLSVGVKGVSYLSLYFGNVYVSVVGTGTEN